jgi:predicted NUDIX family phosphoesterase
LTLFEPVSLGSSNHFRDGGGAAQRHEFDRLQISSHLDSVKHSEQDEAKIRTARQFQ